MTLSVDEAGDLKLGKRKCRLHKKEDVVKVAKQYGVPNAGKKTVKQLCGSIKASMNNVPLAKLYPQATAARKRAEKKMFNRKVAANFMRKMVTNRVVTPTMVMVRAVSPVRIPRPTKKAMPLTKEEATKRIEAMKGLNRQAKSKLVNRIRMGNMSPRRVVKVARELSKLNVAGYRV